MFFSGCLRLYLAQADVGHLKLVLIDGSPQAAVKQLHSSTQCSLSTNQKDDSPCMHMY